jgi:hypothetical protein
MKWKLSVSCKKKKNMGYFVRSRKKGYFLGAK